MGIIQSELPRLQRRCGSCTLCCRLLPVRELDKPANTRCRHQGRQGCAVYHRPGFPVSCEVWSCRWLVADDTEDMPRPDRCGWVIDIMPDAVRLRNNETGDIQEVEIVQIWVEPGCVALSDKRLIRYIERQAKRGVAVLLRYGSKRATAVFGSAMASDGKMHVIGDEQVTRIDTMTGNYLLDRAMVDRALGAADEAEHATSVALC